MDPGAWSPGSHLFQGQRASGGARGSPAERLDSLDYTADLSPQARPLYAGNPRITILPIHRSDREMRPGHVLALPLNL